MQIEREKGKPIFRRTAFQVSNEIVSIVANVCAIFVIAILQTCILPFCRSVPLHVESTALFSNKLRPLSSAIRTDVP